MLLDPRLWFASADQLMEQGYEALEAGEPERALALSRILKKKRHSSAYEIGGRALWALERWGEAVAELEEGVRITPEVRVLWDYLGEFLSDTGRYEEAIDAFERSKQCRYREPGTADYNISIVYQRQGRHEEALTLLGSIPDDEAYSPPPRELIESSRMYSMNALGRYEETVAVAESLSPGEIPDDYARRLTYYAEALWRGRNERERAIELLWEAVAIDRSVWDTWRVLRQIRGRSSATMQRFYLSVEGEGLQSDTFPDGASGYLTDYEVCADTIDEAMGYVREAEVPMRCRSIELKEVRQQESAPDELAGIVSFRGGYTFY